MTGPRTVDVLIPTYRRPVALAITLTSLVGQDFEAFRVVVSDQTEDGDVERHPAVLTPARVLRALGREVVFHKHLPRRGMAEHRQALLDRCEAPFALFLDDDVVLERGLIGRLVETIERERCGFVGSAVVGLSHAHDERPHEQAIEFWDGRVQPEEVRPGSPAWERWRLHNAANPWHIARDLGITADAPRTYRVAWVGGCVLYDAAKLRAAGGFDFWEDLPPEHAGEDVLAQLRVMRRFGGCGLLPSGAFHQEWETTIPDRTIDAPRILDI